MQDFFHQQYYLTRPYFWEGYVKGGRLTSHDHQLFYDTHSFEGIYPYLEVLSPGVDRKSPWGCGFSPGRNGRTSWLNKLEFLTTNWDGPPSYLLEFASAPWTKNHHSKESIQVKGDEFHCRYRFKQKINDEFTCAVTKTHVFAVDRGSYLVIYRLI